MRSLKKIKRHPSDMLQHRRQINMPRKECKFIEWEAEDEDANTTDEETDQSGDDIECEFDDFINDETESESDDNVRISKREKICDPDELLNLQDSSPSPTKRRRVVSTTPSDSSFVIDDSDEEIEPDET